MACFVKIWLDVSDALLMSEESEDGEDGDWIGCGIVKDRVSATGV